MTSASLRPLADTFAWNTGIVAGALADLNDEQAGTRMRKGDGSSITFIAGHLMATRCSILQTLGKREDNPWAEVYGGSSPARDASEYPPLAELCAPWPELGDELAAALTDLDEAALEAPGPEWLPVADKTVRGMLMFLAWHETYHVGQIGLMRVEHDLPSVQSLARGDG